MRATAMSETPSTHCHPERERAEQSAFEPRDLLFSDQHETDDRRFVRADSPVAQARRKMIAPAPSPWLRAGFQAGVSEL